ncbi:MAG: hypothetical protein ACRYG8_16495 [Janthinobacterium lividum]
MSAALKLFRLVGGGTLSTLLAQDVIQKVLWRRSQQKLQQLLT